MKTSLFGIADSTPLLDSRKHQNDEFVSAPADSAWGNICLHAALGRIVAQVSDLAAHGLKSRVNAGAAYVSWDRSSHRLDSCTGRCDSNLAI
jgi:hypothetical protein